MKRSMFFMLVVLNLVGPARAADPETILPSTALMRDQAQAMKDLDAIVKETAPWDAAVVASRMAILVETSFWLKSAFPEDEKGRATPESRYWASPKVWETRADFDARAQRLVDAIRAAAPKLTSPAALRATLPSIGEACGDCHKAYRLER